MDNGSGEPGFCAAWFFYDHTSDFADIIRSAKFDDRPAFARALGRLYARELLSAAHVDGTPGHLSDVEILMPVPMHWSKLLGRGYNQSREIALGISEVTGIPVADNLMARKPHRTQIGRVSRVWRRLSWGHIHAGRGRSPASRDFRGGTG